LAACVHNSPHEICVIREKEKGIEEGRGKEGEKEGRRRKREAFMAASFDLTIRCSFVKNLDFSL